MNPSPPRIEVRPQIWLFFSSVPVHQPARRGTSNPVGAVSPLRTHRGCGRSYDDTQAKVIAALKLRTIKHALRYPLTQRAILVVLVAVGLVVAIVGSRGSPRGRTAASRSQSSSASATTASPAAVFVHDPYMGVSCHIPDSIACDRVGLAVWLAQPATVTATIAGVPLRLNDPSWSYVAYQSGMPLYVYAGFLQPAGLVTRLHVAPIGGTTWPGVNAPTPLVRFRVDYGRRNVVITQEHVQLHAGWG